MEIVEVGIKLSNDFNVKTHDIYYTNKNLDNLTENEIKNSCIRLRSCNDSTFIIQNNLANELDIKEVSLDKLSDYEKNYQILAIRKHLILLNMIIIIIKMV